MAEEDPIELPIEPPAAERHYGLLCLLMLVVMTALLLERLPDIWSVLPLVFGAAFLVIQWREGPAVVLFLIVWLVASEKTNGDPPSVLIALLGRGLRYFARRATIPVFDDFLLAGAFLVYTASYYRFLGFARNLFPLDPRQRSNDWLIGAERRRLLEVPQRRSPYTVTPREFGLLALTVPLCIGGAAGLWYFALADQTRRFEWDEVLWSAMKLMYLFGIPLLLYRAALFYSIQCRASRGECLMFLQDQLWRETRREQSRTNRWLTWTRLRAQRRKEK